MHDYLGHTIWRFFPCSLCTFQWKILHFFNKKNRHLFPYYWFANQHLAISRNTENTETRIPPFHTTKNAALSTSNWPRHGACQKSYFLRILALSFADQNSQTEERRMKRYGPYIWTTYKVSHKYLVTLCQGKVIQGHVAKVQIAIFLFERPETRPIYKNTKILFNTFSPAEIGQKRKLIKTNQKHIEIALKVAKVGRSKRKNQPCLLQVINSQFSVYIYQSVFFNTIFDFLSQRFSRIKKYQFSKW